MPDELLLDNTETENNVIESEELDSIFDNSDTNDIDNLSDEEIEISDSEEQSSYGSEISNDLLQNINDTVNLISDYLAPEEVKLNAPMVLAAGNSSPVSDGYYFTYQNEYIYIPVDKIQYFSKLSDNRLINLSSSTITCYSLDSSGNRVHQYRFQALGTAEYQQTISGYQTQWIPITVTQSDSNLILGQRGINNIDTFLLTCCLILIGFIAFIKKR